MSMLIQTSPLTHQRMWCHTTTRRRRPQRRSYGIIAAIQESDIYFVANQRMRTEDLAVHFRVTGKSAELWHPETGKIEPVNFCYRGQQNNCYAPSRSGRIRLRCFPREGCASAKGRFARCRRSADHRWNVEDRISSQPGRAASS